MGGLEEGAVYLAAARAPGFAPDLRGGLRPGGEEVVLVLRPPVRVAGRVRTDDLAPCAGAARNSRAWPMA